MQYGFLGIAVVALAIYIMILHKATQEDKKLDREERKTWQEIAENGHIAIKEHTEVLTRLSTLLETVINRKIF